MSFQRIKNDRVAILVKLLLCFAAGLLSAFLLIRLFRW
jgi:hypothetical protein